MGFILLFFTTGERNLEELFLSGKGKSALIYDS
jgi:hypothetical protein